MDGGTSITLSEDQRITIRVTCNNNTWLSWHLCKSYLSQTRKSYSLWVWTRRTHYIAYYQKEFDPLCLNKMPIKHVVAVYVATIILVFVLFETVSKWFMGRWICWRVDLDEHVMSKQESVCSNKMRGRKSQTTRGSENAIYAAWEGGVCVFSSGVQWDERKKLKHGHLELLGSLQSLWSTGVWFAKLGQTIGPKTARFSLKMSGNCVDRYR